ncbi:MAG: hypothetical protein M1407_05405 [Deltaproteobacteria bacterium]|nr:hypothetical protein [Deltaproteobacteria bacterium]
MTLRGLIVSPLYAVIPKESRKVPKIETYAVSVHEAVSRERSCHPVLVIIEISLTVFIARLRFKYFI